MTQLEVNKLKAKIAKQQDKENKKSWNYVGSQKKASRVTYSRNGCLLYTSPSPRDATLSRMPSSA